MTNIINLTPHAITFVVEDNKIIFEPSGVIARVSSKTQTVCSKEFYWIKIPVTTTVFGEVENLPKPKENTIFIVSSLVAGRVPDRDDVFIPNESIRDDKGRIIGCLSLGKIWFGKMWEESEDSSLYFLFIWCTQRKHPNILYHSSYLFYAVGFYL